MLASCVPKEIPLNVQCVCPSAQNYSLLLLPGVVTIPSDGGWLDRTPGQWLLNNCANGICSIPVNR